MLQKLLFALLLIILAVPAALAQRVPVVVSIIPEKWLVEQIGGGLVSMHVLLDKGQDPHGLQPTPEQVTALFRARLYFTVGLEFERELAAKVRQFATAVRVIDVSTGIRKLPMTGHEHADGHESGIDPHVWLDPENLREMASVIAAALAQTDPVNAAVYQQNLKRLDKTLAALNEELKAVLAPCKGQAFFVFHPAFGYFAHAFGLRQEAVEMEGKSPSPKQLFKLTAKAKEAKTKVIFIQPQFDRRNAETLAQAIGGQAAVLDPMAEDVPENLRRMAEQIRAALTVK